VKAFRLSLDNVPLPRGTEVVLKVDLLGADGVRLKRGTAARVDVGHHQTYELLTPSGRRLIAARDQLAIQKHQVADRLLAQAESFPGLR